MNKFKAVFGVMFLGLLMFTFNSCTEDNPVYERSWEEGPTTNGNLEVFVRMDDPTGAFLASAEVKLYLSQDDLDNGNFYKMNLTDPDDPANKGAYFKELPFNYYYIQVKWRQSSTDAWRMGTAETWVPKGTTITTHVTAVY